MMKFETFVKCMMMTTSDSDQEALTAIRKANQMLRDEKKNWEELITGLVPMQREAPQPRPRPAAGTKDYASEMDEVFQEALARVRPGSSFRATVESIHSWWQEKGFLTAKQEAVVLKAAGRDDPGRAAQGPPW